MGNNQKLRIVHVLRAPMGGVLRHVRDLAIPHTALGHDVGIICDVAGNEGYNETLLDHLHKEMKLGVTRVAMGRSIGPSDIFTASKVRKHLKELRPDVIHGHGAKGGVFARVCGSLIRTDDGRPARLYSPHGGSLHFNPNSRNGRVYFRVERMLERMTDGLNFVAKFEQDSYHEKIGIPDCPSEIIHNGLTEQEFEPVKLVERPVDFVFVGEMRMLKGPDLLIRAVARLKAEGAKPINVIMVGAGPDRDALQKMIGERDVQANITIQTPMAAREAFALAHCVVMPSRAEALPYVVLEALAAGRPLITTNVGGIPEIFGDAHDVLIDPDIDQLTDRMRLGLNDPAALAKQMPDHAMIKQWFSAQFMAENVLATYVKAVKARRRV